LRSVSRRQDVDQGAGVFVGLVEEELRRVVAVFDNEEVNLCRKIHEG
jgi:hypothetical protein